MYQDVLGSSVRRNYIARSGIQLVCTHVEYDNIGVYFINYRLCCADSHLPEMPGTLFSAVETLLPIH